MSSSTALAVFNSAADGLWDYVRTALIDGGLIYLIIGITVLFVGWRWIKRFANRRF